jgi:glycine cleavage system transcriptional repressor
MAGKFILTAFCKDRPGIVADISQVIYENNCNLEDSAMMTLSGEFGIILLFSPLAGDNDNGLQERLDSACRRLERERGITAFIRPIDDTLPAATAHTVPKKIRVEGMDQAGIVYKVSRYLADQNINIRTLNSKIVNSPESGGAIYRMVIEVDFPVEMAPKIIVDGLNAIGEALHVDVIFEA